VSQKCVIRNCAVFYRAVYLCSITPPDRSSPCRSSGGALRRRARRVPVEQVTMVDAVAVKAWETCIESRSSSFGIMVVESVNRDSFSVRISKRDEINPSFTINGWGFAPARRSLRSSRRRSSASTLGTATTCRPSNADRKTFVGMPPRNPDPRSAGGSTSIRGNIALSRSR
jgi:hypothetical protein